MHPTPLVSQLGRRLPQLGAALIAGNASMTLAASAAEQAIVPAAPFIVEACFNFGNVCTLPFWLAMVFLPGWSLTRRAMESYWPMAVPALMYGIQVATILATADGQMMQAFSDMGSLAGLTRMFSVPSAAAVGWMHYIAFDLFVGRWVYLDGQRNNVFTSHSLVGCLFFGPLGFLLHLATREVTAKLRGVEFTDVIVAGSLPPTKVE